MRTLLFAVIATFVCAMASPGIAADLQQQKKVAASQNVPPAAVVCLRWIAQTYSWYNFCDPVPYYERRKIYY